MTDDDKAAIGPDSVASPEASSARLVVSISGGKDSAAMSLHLREMGLAHERVFCDTGWEHPATYDYIQHVLEPALGPIQWLRSDRGGMESWIRSKAMFPSRWRRYCTEQLKVLPIRAHLIAVLAEEAAKPDGERRPVINAVGIRRLESSARAQLPEWERWVADARGDLDCWIWRPFVEWTEQQVIEIHRRHALPPNPLYLLGATRVGCWPCIHSRKTEIALVARESPERIALIRELESTLTDAARSRAAARAGRPWPDGLDEEMAAIETALRDPGHDRHERSFFQQGPAGNSVMRIDDVVAWANTDRGGKQMPLFSPLDQAATDGCMRWGMCEVAADDPEDGGVP